MDRDNDGNLTIARNIPLLTTIHEKPIKLKPNRSDEFSDTDIIKVIDFHLAI